MKKSKQYNQLQIVEEKLRVWRKPQKNRVPPSGWIKAIRGALGLTTRQLAKRIGITQPAVVALEEREAKGKVTLEALERAAQAMECQLIYAIVPKEEFKGLNDIINKRAIQLAERLVARTSHSMKLELQGVSKKTSQHQVRDLAENLKENMDSRIWDIDKEKNKKK